MRTFWTGSIHPDAIIGNIGNSSAGSSASRGTQRNPGHGRSKARIRLVGRIADGRESSGRFRIRSGPGEEVPASGTTYAGTPIDPRAASELDLTFIRRSMWWMPRPRNSGPGSLRRLEMHEKVPRGSASRQREAPSALHYRFRQYRQHHQAGRQRERVRHGRSRPGDVDRVN